MIRMLMLASAAAVAVTVSGCGSNEQVVRDCCYQGEVAAGRLSGLPLTLEDGRKVPVPTALEGFRPEPGFGGARYPVREVDLRFVAQRDLRRIFERYDANANDHLEQPELTVLYVSEAARGIGLPVAYLGDGAAIGALDTSPADIMGLVAYVNANRHRMTPTAQKVFTEMEALRDLMRVLNSSGTDREKFFPK